MKIAVIGAGPAGMSCANALLSFGLEPIVIERTGHVGGIQRGNFHPNLWMLGMPGETGIEITDRLTRHFFDLPLACHMNAEIRSVTRNMDGFRLRLDTAPDTFSLTVAAVVVTTGSRPRDTPELAALAQRSTRVIVGPLSEAIRDDIRSSRVLILGGGDNALDHALFLAKRDNRVTVCARRDFSARRHFLNTCTDCAHIELRRTCQPTDVTVSDAGVQVDWDGTQEAYDWLLAMYGYEPNTTVLQCFDPGLRPRLTASGHIHVARGQRTSVSGIYAAGDVTDCIQPSVPTAIAQGLAAAKAVEQDYGKS